MPADGPLIFLTGGSGVVGQALLEILPPGRVVCLVHRTPIEREGVECVKGDIVEPRYGLSEERFDELARRVECVVHVAAITDFFTVGREEIEATNVRGTERALELASRAGAPLHYVSTAFVGASPDLGPGEGEPRRELPGIAAAAEGYRMSKIESEKRVRDSGLEFVIHRPSILFGDSRTGEISRFQGILATFKSMLRGEVPALPVSPDGRIDLIPQDVVAAAIAGLIERDQREGVYWLTMGESALPVPRLTELCVEEVRRQGLEVEVPAIVDPAIIDQLMQPEAMASLPPEARESFERQLAGLIVAGPRDPMPSSLAELESRGVLTLPDPETAFMNCFRYWVRETGVVEEARA